MGGSDNCGRIVREVPGWVPIGPVRKKGSNYVRTSRCGCGRVGDAACDTSGILKNKTCIACHGQRRTRHGQSVRGRVSSLYTIWQKMLDRCFNPKCVAYPNYGGRGITVCAAWRESFEAFERDVGPRPEHLELDRKNNDGNYEPGNVRWVTRVENQNNKRTNRRLTHNGETLTVSEWARRVGLKPHTLMFRLDRSEMSLADALAAPADDWVNTRRQNNDYTTITHGGETLTCWQWAERTGISRATLKYRIDHGWTPERALTTPPR